MSNEVNLDIVESFLTECNVEGDSEISLKTNGLTKNAIEALLKMYYEEKEIRKNKELILKNIREEFLKYDWVASNRIQVYNQLKSIYEKIFCKPLLNDDELLAKTLKKRAKSREYYYKHKEERKAYQKKYAKEHYDKVLEANKKYKQKHPEKFAESKKKWYDKNKEKILKQQKEYRFKMKLKNYEE